MGALTLKAFSDELREWEFIEGESIDPTDSFGVNLRLSIRENQVFLAEPNDPETPWLTDKGRLFFDGMFEKNLEQNTNWKNIFQEIFDVMYFVDHLNLSKKNIAPFIFAFENLSIETLNMLYLLKQNCSMVQLRQIDTHRVDNDLEQSYTLKSISNKPKLHMSTLGILINTNPRYEGYVLNLNMRQRFLKGNFKLFNVGSALDLTFPTYNIGSSFTVLESLASGTHLACQDIKQADFPFIVTNTELFKRSDARIASEILKYTHVLDTAWSGLNVLNHNLSNVGVNTLNKFLPLSLEDFTQFFGLYCINTSLNASANINKFIELYMLNIASKPFNSLNFFVEQNAKPINTESFQKMKLTNKSFYLPSNLFLEDNETFINTQGSFKRVTKLLHFKKGAKTNWQIVRKLYANSKSLILFNNKKDTSLINFNAINSFNFKNYTHLQFHAVQSLTSLSFYLTKHNSSNPIFPKAVIKPVKLKVLNTKLKSWLDDFFNNNGKDSFSYNSAILVNCSKIARSSTTNFF